MSDRSDNILALVLPLIAVTWVIADAATGFVAADRSVQSPLPVVQIVDEMNAPANVATGRNSGPVIVCTSNGAVTAASANPQSRGLSQTTLHRICRAGLRFTSRLPRG